MSVAARHPIAPAPDPTPMTAWAYRRAARHIRFRFRHDPVALHASLKRLAAAEDAARVVEAPAVDACTSRSGGRVRRVEARLVPDVNREVGPVDAEPFDVAATAAAVSAPCGTVERFAALVRLALEQDDLGPGILRHSRRQALLGRGVKLGLGPFEANLVIAAVQHRHRDVREDVRVPGRWARGGAASARSVGWLTAAVVAAEVVVGAALALFARA